MVDVYTDNPPEQPIDQYDVKYGTVQNPTCNRRIAHATTPVVANN